MSLCINPHCEKARNEIDMGQNLFCDSCGANLLILNIYRVIRKLGKGGFGITYLIDDAGEKYVLKVLRNPYRKAAELFKQEAEVLKKLDHTGIPKIEIPSPFLYHLNSSEPPLNCLIMEYIQGENLYDYLQKSQFQPISEKAALRWLRQLVQILDLVHGANYFHRDIKPPNIMLRSNGQLALIDFGTAREETETYLQKQQGKQVTGITSPGYTPYEQQYGQAETRSDFFALGRTFVFLLTGQEPANFPDSISQGLQWQNSAQGYAKPLRDFIDELMRPDVEHRPANTTAILEQIAQLEQELYPKKKPTPQPPPPPPTTVNPSQQLTGLNALKDLPWKNIAWVFSFFGIASYLVSLSWCFSGIYCQTQYSYIFSIGFWWLSIFFVNSCIIFEDLRKINKLYFSGYYLILGLPNLIINFVGSIFFTALLLFGNSQIPRTQITVGLVYSIGLLFGVFSVKLYSPIIKALSLKSNHNNLEKFLTFTLRLVTISLGICLGSLIYGIFHF